MRQFKFDPKATPSFEGILRWIRDSSNKFNNQIYAIKTGLVEKLYVSNTSTGNVGSGEDTLLSYVLPSNTLFTTGSGVRITAWGTGANNGSTKTLKMYFGAQVIATDSLTASQVDRWRLIANVWRTGSSTQDWESQFVQFGTISQNVLEGGTATQNENTDLTIRCTGEASNDNDIVQEGLLIEFLP